MKPYLKERPRSLRNSDRSVRRSSNTFRFFRSGPTKRKHEQRRRVYARSRLERHFRDAQTVRHHGFVSVSRLETVGQVYLGVEPEFPFVAF
jgi:hypothetical protein